MPILTRSNKATFGDMIEGNAGQFATPGGEVIFLQTRARLAQGDTSNASRLTARLTPAREALDVRQMDFNQLLQRDLDDHRIAHDLVPYILREQSRGPAFFPPILAALLPFENRQPVPTVPSIDIDAEGTDPSYEGVKWRMSTCGEVFRLQMALEPDGSLDPAGTAILRWNDERAKLVIMDGQHRAMALLAIHRTITNSWGTAGAASERYKAFYEARVRELWEEAERIGRAEQLKKLEFPVTICVFPEYAGAEKNPHMAARKLFVDVNKEAKPPSESRLLTVA